MNTLTGVIADNENNSYALIPTTQIKQFNLRLGQNKVWKLGIDPASKFTGLALHDTSGRFTILLDCKRDTRLPNEQFYDELYFLIKRLVAGEKIERITNEKPFVNKKYYRTSEVLLALRGKIEMWVKAIPELSDAEFKQVNPNTWKSRVIDEKKGKNRFNSPGAIADDLCDKFPALIAYRTSNVAGDLDSFDALGTIIGYDAYAYTENGEKKICGCKEKSHRSLVCYKWVDKDSIGVDFVYNSLGLMGRSVKPECLVYNEEYSFAENIMMATTNQDAITCIIPPTQLQQFQWKFDIDISDQNKVLIMFVFRKGHFTAKECRYLKEQFELTEEMGGE